MYYVYMLRCEDNSLYTGITKDLERRFSEHLNSCKGAKYTKSHRPVKIASAFGVATKSEALRLEYAIKSMKKSKKEMLVTNELDINTVLETEIERISV